ncbi:MAG TPA: prepilin-type N-terminal cleavage/methylation domain-containing protein [Pirellulales bacterium]|jgi:prepilin-type N-terminal cleavage/methylation domain-containing protein|nr:prepilin-type N-terminal cleavage/methylation domain-containing protein [Pirellulales bacterium]
MTRPISGRRSLGSLSWRERSGKGHRAGFTLVELLMVIVIIGMLVALVSTAAVQVLARARQAENTLTIDTFDQAVQNAKNQYGAYPPDCSNLGQQGGATTLPSFGMTYRQNRILGYFRKAFPRMVVTGYGPSGATDPPAGTLQFLSQYAFGNTAPNGQVVAYAGTTIHLGDLNNLDPAEALVFFLGGPPAAAPLQLGGTGSNYGFSLASFSANPQNPFAPGGPRLSSLYQFDQNRLGDADGDGWPEYYPPGASIPQPPGTTAITPASATPPYVYFDSVTYESWIANYAIASTATSAPPQYPGAYPYYSDASGGPLQPTNFAGQIWGTAVPYASSTIVNPTIKTNDFVNPQKFQIIGAGGDNMYSTPGFGIHLRYFPSRFDFSDSDYDNVSNFASGRLQDTAQ